MARNVRVTVLCEDRQHEAFIRRFLYGAGFNPHKLDFILAPKGRGSAEQFVREEFPTELKALRSKRYERVYLIVMMDGDDRVAARKSLLDTACKDAGEAPPGASDRVLVCIPNSNIETWLAYLRGETVDESHRGYQKYDRESECAYEVKVLLDMCRSRDLRQPSPPSLNDACVDYQRVFG